VSSTRSPHPRGARGGGQACPLCGGPARTALTARDLNRAITHERFEYRRCRDCRAYFLVSIPDDLSRYYPPEYYPMQSEPALEVAAAQEVFKVEMLAEHAEGGRLVEIGPGFGAFARAARNAGFDVTAIEMDEPSVEWLSSIVGVRAIQSAAPEEVLPTLEPSRVIAMWHVIEHLPRPWEVLESAAANLQPGGVLVIATPNPQSLQFKLLGRRWAHVDAPRHLFLIPPATLERRCEELGLRLASSTTVDPGGRHWNWFGWLYALRASPRSRPPRLHHLLAARLLATLAAPVEARGQKGCAYTSIFVKKRAPASDRLDPGEEDRVRAEVS
jgi:2-polyprenyl-3-methyl-5-hydroxy-6-metoxy-1,4-benzoquinol methylase